MKPARDLIPSLLAVQCLQHHNRWTRAATRYLNAVPCTAGDGKSCQIERRRSTTTGIELLDLFSPETWRIKHVVLASLCRTACVMQGCCQSSVARSSVSMRLAAHHARCYLNICPLPLLTRTCNSKLTHCRNVNILKCGTNVMVMIDGRPTGCLYSE